MITRLLYIAGGGAVGSVSRFLLGAFVQRLYGGDDFPLGTLSVNVLGCFIIGFLGELFQSRVAVSSGWRFALLVGFLGGFTTFSSFGYETVVLLREARALTALGNVALQLLCGLTAVGIGMATVRWLS